MDKSIGEYYFLTPKTSHRFVQLSLDIWQKVEKEFESRKCKLLGLSADSVKDHIEWKKDIEETQNVKVNYPLIADENLKIAKIYNMLTC